MRDKETRYYYDPRLLNAVDKAVLILKRHLNEWKDEVDAYWLLRKYEDEIDVPVTYDIVEAAVARIKNEMNERKPVEVEA